MMKKPEMHIYSNFGWAHVHDYMAIVHGSFAPTEKEWLKFKLYSMRYPAKGAMVFTIWTPNGEMRKDIFASVKRTPTAILCTSKLARATLAIMASYMDISGFAVDQIDAALDYLKMPHEHRADFLNAFNTVAEQVLNSSEIQVLRPQ